MDDLNFPYFQFAFIFGFLCGPASVITIMCTSFCEFVSDDNDNDQKRFKFGTLLGSYLCTVLFLLIPGVIVFVFVDSNAGRTTGLCLLVIGAAFVLFNVVNCLLCWNKTVIRLRKQDVCCC